MIYLDNAATTFPKPEPVYTELDRVTRTLMVNAGRGSYALAKEASRLIDDTRVKLRRLTGLDENADVIFSPSVTIALNQILNGISWKKGDVVYVSPYEHNAVARTIQSISKSHGIIVEELAIDEETLEINLDKVKYQFSRQNPSAVICNHVSNVTGYILPVREIFSESKKYNAITILDSAQSLGLIPINASTLNLDFLAFAGHKTLYGPFGVGGFINIHNISLDTYITGGTGSDSLNLAMPSGGTGRYEAASPNLAAIGGLNKAIQILDIDKNLSHEKELTQYLVGQFQNNNKLELYAPANPENHIGIVSFNIKGLLAEDTGTILDEDYDIAVRCGYHCAPFIHKYLKDEKYLGTVRVGLGMFNTKDDIDRLVEAVEEI